MRRTLSPLTMPRATPQCSRGRESMENKPDGAIREKAQFSEWRGLIEVVIGSAVITAIFLLAIFVALAY
ncbi:MAG: hypothetical protein HC869_18375 [Rhodospirillales bacterium]|nr:hypothetical protein [Rhodospirillales bacterium]